MDAIKFRVLFHSTAVVVCVLDVRLLDFGKPPRFSRSSCLLEKKREKTCGFLLC